MKKSFITNILLKISNVKQVHIIGCARSGTTMLYYSMTAFQNTFLNNHESFPWRAPELREAIHLMNNVLYICPQTNYMAVWLCRKRGLYHKKHSSSSG